MYTVLSGQRRMLLLGALTGVLFYTVWTVIGLLCYTGTAPFDAVRTLVAAVAGGVTAGLLCAWLLSVK